MDIFHHTVIAVCSQGIRDQAVEGLLLAVSVQWDTGTAEHIFQEIFL